MICAILINSKSVKLHRRSQNSLPMKDARNSTHIDAINTYTDNAVKRPPPKKRKESQKIIPTLKVRQVQEEKQAHMMMWVWARRAALHG